MPDTTYVTWDYEEFADPPFYHIFSLDQESESLNLPWELFAITARQTPEMDMLIAELAWAIEKTIAAATDQSVTNV